MTETILLLLLSGGASTPPPEPAPRDPDEDFQLQVDGEQLRVGPDESDRLTVE